MGGGGGIGPLCHRGEIPINPIIARCATYLHNVELNHVTFVGRINRTDSRFGWCTDPGNQPTSI